MTAQEQFEVDFKREAPELWNVAKHIINHPNLTVEIEHTNEIGHWCFAITVATPNGYNGFWLDTRQTKESAVQLCKDMGWKLHTEEGDWK